VVVLVLSVRGRLPELRAARRRPDQVRLLGTAAALVSVNWLVYIWAVNSGHVIDAALGYYINPLITVALGVVVLGEQLRGAQRVALGLGAVAVVVLTVSTGTFPWIAVVLACTFAGYGYMKKSVDVAAIPSLAVETAILLPLALVSFAVLAAQGELEFTHGSSGRDAMLVSLGVVTAVPLILFATAARRIPLSMLGLLQYATPTLQLLCGLLLLDEHLTPARFAGFVLIWIALSVLASDAVGRERRYRRTIVQI
jgi:chloramphenicol-sensitive protein RarD